MSTSEKQKVEYVSKRDKMTYHDHMKKLYAEGKITRKELISSKTIKNKTRSKYDL